MAQLCGRRSAQIPREWCGEDRKRRDAHWRTHAACEVRPDSRGLRFLEGGHLRPAVSPDRQALPFRPRHRLSIVDFPSFSLRLRIPTSRASVVFACGASESTNAICINAATHKRRRSEVCPLGQSDFYRMSETWIHVRSNTTRGDANHRPLAFRCVLWILRWRKIRRVWKSLWPKQGMPIRRPGLSADPIRKAFAHSALVRLEPSDPQFKRKRKIFTQTFA